MSGTVRDIIQIRASLCLDIAEAIEHAFAFGTHPRWNIDRAARVVNAILPSIYDAAPPESATPVEAPRPSGLSARARKTLFRLGLQHRVELAKLTTLKVRCVKNCGEVTLKELRLWLAEEGLYFADEQQPPGEIV